MAARFGLGRIRARRLAVRCGRRYRARITDAVPEPNVDGEPAPAPNAADSDFLNIRCRANTGGGGETGYRATIRPQPHQIELDRLDGNANNAYVLVGRRTCEALHATGVNRIEMTCSAQTISITVNGTLATSIQDAKYATEGNLAFSIGGNQGHAVEARLDNLVVTLR